MSIRRKLSSLNVNVFNAGFVWPIWVGQETGMFTHEGLDLRLIATPNSVQQMTGLIDGQFEVAMTAIDNVIAYMEGQGEALTQRSADIVSVMGSDNGFLSLIAAPDLRTYSNLRGKTLSVDAMTTGYAFALRKILEVRGLKEGEYRLKSVGGMGERYESLMAGNEAATLSVPPYTFRACDRGFNCLGTVVDVLGSYQGVVAAVRRDWAATHRATVLSFIRANLTAVSWLCDQENKASAIEIYLSRLPGATLENALRSYEVFVHPVTGFSRLGQIDLEGVRTVVKIRRRYGRPHRDIQDPSRYYELGYAEEVVGKSSH